MALQSVMGPATLNLNTWQKKNISTFDTSSPSCSSDTVVGVMLTRVSVNHLFGTVLNENQYMHSSDYVLLDFRCKNIHDDLGQHNNWMPPSNKLLLNYVQHMWNLCFNIYFVSLLCFILCRIVALCFRLCYLSGQPIWCSRCRRKVTQLNFNHV